MNELKITINFKTQKFIIDGIDLISGDYNSTKLVFNFEEDIEGTKTVEIRPLLSDNKNPVFMSTIINNEVILVAKDEENNNASPFSNGGTYLMEVSVYGENSKLSTITKHFNVLDEEIILTDDIIEPYLPIFDELMQNIVSATNEAENVNISISKEENITTVTITNRNGVSKSVEIKDGIDGVGIKTISKIATVGLTDTYRILLTNNKYIDYQITNGKGIVSITKTNTTNNIDTYTILYNDDTTSTFTVTNGTITMENLMKELSTITNILPQVHDSGRVNILNNTGNSKLLTLSVTGETTQSGTPLPTIPSELVSVGYQNLFNKSTISTGKRLLNDGTLLNDNNYNTSDYIKVNAETDYVYSRNSAGGGSAAVCYYKSDKTIISRTTWSSDSSSYNINFTTPQNTGYIKICDLKTVLDNMQITCGTQPHNYISYDKYGIEIINTGKNLFSGFRQIGSNANYINNVLTITSGGTNAICYSNYFVPSGDRKYYFSYNTTYATARYYVAEYDETYTQIRSSSKTTQQTFTIGNDAKYFAIIWDFASSTTFPLTISNMQLEKGTQATPYKEYKSNTYLYTLNEPLRSIGTTKDLLYIKNGYLYVERKIGSVILNGTEDWEESATHVFRIPSVYPSDVALRTAPPFAYSNYFKYAYYSSNITTNIKNGELSWNGSKYLVLRNDNISNVATLKTWLSTHNVEVNYILATPIVEELGAVNMPSTYEGVTEVTITDNLMPVISSTALKDLSNL